MFPSVAAVGRRLTDHLTVAIKSSNELDARDISTRFTLDVIGIVAFGIECNTLKETDNEFYRFSQMALGMPRISPPVSVILKSRTVRAIARFLGVKSVRDDVSSFFMNMIKSTISYRENNNIERKDLMDLLIKMKTDGDGFQFKDGLTMDQIAAQAFIFFLAGFETSALTMQFTLYELAINPHVQTKLRLEIQNAKKKYGDEISYEMMTDIPYLDQTINGNTDFKFLFIL